uniref:Inactive hydroxysteroid dehydrogenase-like protein 1 n=1 Tax=Trichuris muris TaxID=70415 RepID=A0A5S6QW43_TRIMR
MALAVDRAELLINQICCACGKWRDLFAAIGVGFSAYCVYRVTISSVWGIWTHLGGLFNVQRRLRTYGDTVVVIGNPGAVRNELMKRLAWLGFSIILVQHHPREKEIATYFEYEFGTTVISQPAHELSTDCGVRSFRKLLSSHNVGLMIDTTCCFDSLVSRIIPSNVTMGDFREWCKEDVLLRVAAMHTRLHLSSKAKALAVTVVYCQEPERDAYKTNLFLQMLNRSLFLTPPNGIDEQFFLPWRLDRSPLKKDLLWINDAYDKEEAIAGGRYFPWLYRFWVPLPKTYARHATWSMGRPGVTTGYLPHSFLQWWIGLFFSDFTFFPKKQQRQRLEPNEQMDTLSNWAYED